MENNPFLNGLLLSACLIDFMPWHVVQNLELRCNKSLTETLIVCLHACYKFYYSFIALCTQWMSHVQDKHLPYFPIPPTGVSVGVVEVLKFYAYHSTVLLQQKT